MSTTARKGYFVRRLDERLPCEASAAEARALLTHQDTDVCNLHVAFITDSTKHYHRETTEVYYILEGRGKMELNDDVIDIEPGLIVYIEPYTAHRLISPEGVRTIVFGVPAYHPDDEFYCHPGDEKA